MEGGYLAFRRHVQRLVHELRSIRWTRHFYGRAGALHILFLCGYFDSGYLGYEAAEGIDWVWEHRIKELAEFGL